MEFSDLLLNLCQEVDEEIENEIIFLQTKIYRYTRTTSNKIRLYLNELLNPNTQEILAKINFKKEMEINGLEYFYDLKIFNVNQLISFLEQKINFTTNKEVLAVLNYILSSANKLNIENNKLTINTTDNEVFNFVNSNNNHIVVVLNKLGVIVEEVEINHQNIDAIVAEHYKTQHEMLVNEINQMRALELKQQQEQTKNFQKQQNNSSYKSFNRNNVVELITLKEAFNPEFLNQRKKIKGVIFVKETKEWNPENIETRILIYDNTDTFAIKFKSNPNNLELSKKINDLKMNQEIEAIVFIGLDFMDKTNQTFIGNLKEIVSVSEIVEKQTISPRIELAFHTKMSAFDSIIGSEELVKYAKKNNLQTIGISDRNVVQAYPEISKISKKEGINIIYGVETEELNDQIDVGLNIDDKNINLNQVTYVVFDIETTGLFPNFDEIIEFGAVRYVNGEVVDKKQFFVKPIQKISDRTTALTKITQEHVDNAKDEKSALIDIVEYFKDDILVAHNAINFDISFINRRLEIHNLKKLTNPVIDTLLISRAINETSKSHRLGALCKLYKVDYDDSGAHRADYDADVLVLVFRAMLHSLNTQFQITNINQLNQKLQTESSKRRYFGNWINLYIKQQENTKDMYELVSVSHTTQFHDRPIIYKSFIDQKKDRLLLTNSVHESDLINACFNLSKEDILKTMQRYDFITLPSIGSYHHMIGNEKISLENLKLAFSTLVECAIESKKLIIYSSSPFYLRKEDKKFYDIVVNTKGLKERYHRFRSEEVVPDFHYVDLNEARQELEYLSNNDLINQILEINPKTLLETIDLSIKPLKEGLYAPKIENVDEKTIEYVYQTARNQYGDNLPKIVEDRIKKELDSIIKHKFSVVYWISHLLVKKSNDEGYSVGSRGSVGSSLIATFLKITDVNPLPAHYLCPKCFYYEFFEDIDDGFDLLPKKCPTCQHDLKTEGHNIPFETFLGFDGDKVPDIDLNFSGEYQPVAHNFIRETFGEERSYRAGTIGTMKEKTAFSIVKKYFEEKFENQQDENEQIRQTTLRLFNTKLIDIKRTTGQHPGGIIVVPDDFSILDFSPYNYPANMVNEEWRTTHFEYEYLHDNLLKFDILGHDNPTILKILKEYTGIDEKEVPVYDENVMRSFSDITVYNVQPKDVLGEVTGAISCPEYGTDFTRRMLIATKPKTFADLVRISGLSHGENVWSNNAENLIKGGKLLKDVIACRDDIMTYLMSEKIEAKTSFQIMEDVRKGKKIKPEHQQILIDNKIPQWYIESANKIKYMFPKAHAVAYAMHAWKFSWFKLHYPLQYYAAYFSVRAEKFNLFVISKGKMAIEERFKELKSKGKSITAPEREEQQIFEIVVELLARGFKVQNIDLIKSDATRFLFDLENKAIIPPFSTLQGLGEAAANSVIDARKSGEFKTIEDLKKRTKLSKTNIADLRELGVLDGMSENDQTTLF